VKSIVLQGLEVLPADVEVGFSRGIPGTAIVGLPDNAVKESKERIRFAIKNSGFEYPLGLKVVVNLSPADVKKEGAAYDLPIAAGIIANHYDISTGPFEDFLLYGELNLNGQLKPVKGVLNLALFARDNGYKGIVIPCENANEAAFVKGIDIYPFTTLKEVVEWAQTPSNTTPYKGDKQAKPVYSGTDFSEIKGQYLAKRVMEIAAAGFHNVLMIGPPGSGKSMISRALPSILPDMSEDEILETSLIYSAAGLMDRSGRPKIQRPFRSPHHTISDVGISGGGKYPVPGEISLAHNGVLFLDELPHFKKSALEVLRQPLEDGEITISRSLTSYTFPARFMLIAAMNPSQDSYCDTEYQRKKYYSKISRPLLDRIDLYIEVKKVEIDEITSKRPAESSANIKKRITAARSIQLQRYGSLRKRRVFANGQMNNREIKAFCQLDGVCAQVLKTAVDKLNLSARSYFRILKIARTIADLERSPNIEIQHIHEALQYRTIELLNYST
jgi:magnesium chelatase family protein